MHPWSAESLVSAELARSLIEAQFPQLAPARVEPFGAGWDNSAFLVNEAFVFRFPRRQVAVALLEAEARLLPALAPRLPLSVPVPTFAGVAAESYPWPFAGHVLIPGRTACTAQLTDDQRRAAAEPLAGFLATLHAIPASEAARLGAGPDPIDRLNVTGRLPRARELLDRLTGLGLVEDARPFAAVLDTAAAAAPPRADTLVHGDLYARQLLVDGDNRLTGVIDWGDIHLGDPAADLMVVYTFLPPGARPAFERAYGPVPAATWHLARLRAVWHTLNVAAYAHDIGDGDLLREARVALGYLAAEAPPG
ncbi:MAG: phosphotransferase [Gemmataceae bacterium]|nr:phosphotransferase [Gemmataceae bacterium]